jgi:hypothetical protein
MKFSLSGVSFRVPGLGPFAPRVYLKAQPCCGRRLHPKPCPTRTSDPYPGRLQDLQEGDRWP